MAKKVSASSQNVLLHIDQTKKSLSFSKILLAEKAKTMLSELFTILSKTDSGLFSMCVCVRMHVVLRPKCNQGSSVTLARSNSNTVYNFVIIVSFVSLESVCLTTVSNTV